MSLERFSNISEIRTTGGLSRGLDWKQAEVAEFQLTELVVRPDETPVVEMHMYTPTTEAYLGGGPITSFIIKGDKIYIDYVEAFRQFNINRGYFKVVINVYYDIIGTYEYPILKVNEIAPNNQELLLTDFAARAEPDDTSVSAVKQFIDIYDNAFANDFALNLGENRFAKIIGFKEFRDENTLAIRLYQPIQGTSIVPLQRVHLVEMITDSYIDNISLDQLAPTIPPNTLKPANFEVDTGYTTITETDFKNWNQLLNTTAETSQRLIQSVFSGSLQGVDLGIDFTGFENFVFYGSAYDRIYNFKQKLEQIEYYDARLSVLNNTSGSSSGSLASNINSTQKRKDALIGTFDSFETWLYNEPTASLYTHALSGSVIAGEYEYATSPWPKYLSNGAYKLYHTTSSIAENWYYSASLNGRDFDTQNPNALVKTIPQYIRSDSSNSEYDNFVNMIGQHFDILYTYAKALTERVYVKEEHPKRGIDKDILPMIAKSQGWQLVNGKQASQLWQYKLGTNESGSYAQTGSLFSVPDEQITGEVWRRIVNNLPYILKTRGTIQSIKALLNIYGVPQTLLSVREYGGPKVGADEFPVLTEDRYCYAVRMTSGSSISYSTVHVSASLYNWGRELTDPNVIPVQTREFRFRPFSTSSMILYSQVNSSGDPLMHMAIEHTGSYSGSAKYGRLNVSFGSGSGTSPITASSDWVPLYNGDFWNVAYAWLTTGGHFNTGSNSDTTYRFRIQQASDFIKGKVSHTSSFDINPTNTDHYKIWSHPNTLNENIVYIGGNTGSSDTLDVNLYLSTLNGSMPGTFSGSMQEYREYLEYITQDAFDDHTLNPTSYVSGISPTGSYDTLVRHYMLGTETIGIDLSTDGTIISSSHPNQNVTDFTTNNAFSTNATSNGFATPPDLQRGNFIPVEETYYMRGVSLGASNPRSQKIRLEENSLIRRLSPTNTAEVSSFDNAPLDSHKLGLFYSFADQVNKDIFNHTGRVELDDFVGDPDDEYNVAYEDLKYFATQYWKKFTNSSDINSYNRIFSQYDFSLFNQIKQTLPERVDEVTGLLIEPNVIERSKVQITRQPIVENPQYDVLITQQQPTWSADYIQYEGAITTDESKVLTPTGSFVKEYSDNMYVIQNSGSMNYCTIETLPVDELVQFTSSIIDSNFIDSNATASIYTYYNTQDVIYVPDYSLTTSPWISKGASTQWRENITNGATNADTRIISSSIGSNLYATQIRLQLDTISSYDTKIDFDIKLKGTTDSAASGSYIALLATTTELNGDVNVNHRYDNILAASEGVLLLDDSLETISFDTILIPANTYITLILQFKNIDASEQLFTIKQITPLSKIIEVCHSAKQFVFDNPRLSSLYSQNVYHYSGSKTIENKRERINNGLVSQSLGLYYSRSLQTAPYHDDFWAMENNLYFDGSKLKAPGINLPTKDNALNGRPVIEVYEVNPNQLFYNTTPQQPGPGNTLDPGNLTVR